MAGTYTVTITAAAAANSLTVTDATAKVVDNAALSLTTTLSLAAGSFTLGSGGALTVGTINVATGASFTSTAGTLSGVTFDGTLGVTAANASVALTGTDTFAGASGTGAGTINLTGSGARLYAQDNTLLDNATLTFGSASTAAYIDVQSLASSNDTLTLGSNFNLVQSAASSQGTIDLYSYTSSAGTLVNQGTITASASKGYLSIYGGRYAGDAFVNTGTVAVSNGDTLDLSQLGTFTNTGTLSATGSLSTVNFGGSWTEQGVLSAASGATLNLGGTFTVASTGTIANSGGTVNLTGTLNNAGTTFAVGSAITLDSGTITGGTVAVGSAGTFTSVGGTLSGVAFDGTLGVSAANASVALTGTDTFAGASGTGAGTINLTGSGAQLYAQDNTLLDNATLNFGSASTAAYIDVQSLASSNDTLTFGSHLNLVQSTASSHGTIDLYSYTSNSGTLVNQGTITASASKGYLSIYGANSGEVFTNSGTVAVSNGDTLDLSTVNAINNTGAISVTGSASVLNIGGTWLNSGSVSVASGGDINIEGVLANAGTTLTINSGVGTLAGTVDLSGVISGGTIIDASGVLTGGSGTLSGVTYDGTLNETAINAALYFAGNDVFNGSTGTGAGTINLTGNGAHIFAQDNTLLDNATLNLGGTTGSSTIFLESNTSGNDTLTFGSHLNLVQSTASSHGTIDLYSYTSNSGTLVNQGTITASASKGYLSIYGANSGEVFTNSGTVAVSNGDTLDLSTVNAINNTGAISVTGSASVLNIGGTWLNSGSVSVASGGDINIGGVLANAGTTLTINSGVGTLAGTVDLSGVISGGTIIDASGVLTGGSGTLSGVTYDGTLNETAINAALYFAGNDVFNGSTGTGAGTINLTGNGAHIFAQDNTLLDNATLNLGGTTGSSTIFLESNTSGNDTLTFGSHLNLVQSTASSHGTIDLYSYTSNSGTLVNQGTITASASKGYLSIYGANSGEVFTNSGTVAVSNGDTLDLSTVNAINNTGAISVTGSASVLNIGGTLTNQGDLVVSAGADINLSGALTNLKSGILTGGSYEADAGSTLQLSGNSTITTDSAKITLQGAGSVIELLKSTGTYATIDSQLSTIGTAGVLSLLAGRNLTATANTGRFTDSGTLMLGASTLTATALTVSSGAYVVGSGGVHASVTNTGIIEAASGTLLITGSIAGTGALQVDAGATLELSAGVAATQTASFSGQGGVLKFDSAPTVLATVAGYTAGNVINLGTLVATSASITGAELSVGLSSGSSVSYTLSAPGANERVSISADGHSLTAYREATASTHSPEPVSFGNHHVGDVVSTNESLSNIASADGFSESLDAAFGGATAGVTTAGSITGLAAGNTDSTDLSVGLNTSAAGTVAGSAVINLATDGTGTDGQAALSIGTQTVTVTGAVYNYAAASLASTAVTLANQHVGATDTTSLSVGNTAAAGAYSEALDAAVTGSTGAATGTGTLSGVAAGSAGSLAVGLSTAIAGALTGTDSIAFASDGTGIDGLGTTALGTQTVTVTGAAYNYAAGSLANGGTVTLAETHVGQAATGLLTVTNIAAAGNYSEALDGAVTGATAGLSATGSFTGLAAGSSTSLTLGATSSTAGAYTDTATLGLTSDGAGIDGLGTTTLAGQTVAVTGAAYAYASAQVASTTINLGVVHTGSVTSQALMLSNVAAANGYSEALDASLSGGSAGVTLSGSLTGLAAGASSSGLAIGLSTASSGSYSGTATLGLVSDGAGIDTLGTTTLTGQTITVTETVDNYAVAAFQDPGGPAATGTSTNETISLGSVTQGAAALTLSLGALNAATGLSDLLQGSITTAGGTGFTNSGFGSFSGLAAGAGEQAQRVSLSTSTAGTFTETVVLSSSGTNASGYNGALANETLTITGTITPSGTTSYVLAVGPNTITGADGGDIFQAVSGALNSHDSLTGGNGANVLQLAGVGSFDIGAPKVFTNIQTINAHEGQAASGTLAATNQTLFLRDGTTETVNVAAGTPAAGNSGPETIAIYDGNDTDNFALSTGTDTLYLGAGTDTVTLGGAKNSIVAGGGTATINGTALQAVASVVGVAAGLTTLNITSAGIVALNAADTYVTVNLVASSKLTLGTMGFITANGGAGKETILAGGANQTLIGGAADVLTGNTGGSDTFLGASAALSGDTIGNWTTGDVIDLTDMNSSSLKQLTYTPGKTSGVLTIGDGTHTSQITFSGSTTQLHNFTVVGSDGHGGTFIDFHT